MLESLSTITYQPNLQAKCLDTELLFMSKGTYKYYIIKGYVRLSQAKYNAMITPPMWSGVEVHEKIMDNHEKKEL